MSFFKDGDLSPDPIGWGGHVEVLRSQGVQEPWGLAWPGPKLFGADPN